jgi:hypothetical protein
MRKSRLVQNRKENLGKRIEALRTPSLSREMRARVLLSLRLTQRKQTVNAKAQNYVDHVQPTKLCQRGNAGRRSRRFAYCAFSRGMLHRIVSKPESHGLTAELCQRDNWLTEFRSSLNSVKRTLRPDIANSVGARRLSIGWPALGPSSSHTTLANP